MNKAVVDVLIAATLYYVAARFGLLFAIPPGFASAIWPAAGIGLAICLTRGNTAFLGIFIGSLLANLPLFKELSFELSSDLLPAAIIAAGSTLQMVLTKKLINALKLWPINELQNVRIFLFLLITGPLCCLVAATIGTVVQANITTLSWEALQFIWFTWWVGDSVGVMFFCPLTIVILRLIAQRQLPLDIGYVVASMVMFFLVALVFAMSRATHDEKVQAMLSDKASQVINYIKGQLEITESQLFTLRALFQSNEDVSHKKFNLFTNDFFIRNYSLRAIEWIPVVTKSNFDTVIEAAKKDGLDEFKFKNIDGSQVNKESNLEPIYPVYYINPLEPNLAALGLNLASEPMRKQTLINALSADRVVASFPIDLVQEDEQYPGILLLLRVASTGDENSKALGLALSVIQLNRIFERINSEVDITDVNIQVFQEESVVYQTGELGGEESQFKLQFNFFDKQWSVGVTPRQTLALAVRDWQSWLIIVSGFLVAILAQGFLLVMSGYQKELKTQVAQRTRDMEAAKNEAERANKAKSQFLANMSHEIRTPLNAVMGYAQLGLADQNADHKKAFEAILKSSNILLRLLGEVLDLAKIEAGRQVIEHNNFNFYHLMDRVNTSFKNIATVKGLEFRYCIDTSVPEWINGDEVRIEQVINNLVSNAIKFTENGYVSIDVSAQVKEADKLKLELIVKDSGIGMPEDVVTKVFSAFIQADESHTRKYGGTGLGLTITRRLCELMDGSISVISHVGKGSEFKVCISVYEGVEEKAYSQDTNQLTFENKKILVVEDVPVNQKLLVELLKLFKCKAVAVDDGLQAVQYLTENQDIDLVFMDIQMPVMDGFEATSQIRNELKLTLPIIALSADVIEKDKTYALGIGINYFLTKPVNLGELQKVLSRYLTKP